MKKSTFRKIPRLFVVTLMMLNGLVNIVFSFSPESFYGKSDLSDASHLVQYVTYQQASSIITIAIGAALIYLSIGLLKKQRRAWLYSIGLLLVINFQNIYPSIKAIPLSLGLLSIIILLSSYKHFNVKQRTPRTNSIIAWLSVIFAMAYGSIGCYLLRAQFKGIHNFIDSIYFTLVTYSTVGYGDITPASNDAKLFVITMIFVGLGSFATVITVLLGPLLERRLKKVFTMVEYLSHMRNHAIICGVNQTTQQMAKELEAKGIEVLFVDSQQDKLSEVERREFDTLHADIADKNILKQAGLLDSKMLVCAEKDDAKNILITMLAKELLNHSRRKNKIQLITLLEKPSNADSAKKAGADELIIPALLGSNQLLTMLKS
jgi:voltage-gated potassium channel